MSSAQQVISGLVARGLPYHIAVGVAGNMAVESDGFKTDVNEYAPIVPGSRGGYGLNQWTGPRRRQFEAFANERGVKASDLDTQLDFTVWELRNSEKRAGDALMQAGTHQDAARIYSEKFLRPGIPHLDRRIAEADALYNGGYSQQPPQAPQNALATMAPPKAENALYQPTDGRIDPRGFQNALNPIQQTLTVDQFRVG